MLSTNKKIKNGIIFRNISNEDQSWIDNFIEDNWGSSKVVVHNEIFRPSSLKGFIAEQCNNKIGLVTFVYSCDYCEIITLDATVKNLGIGTNLVKLVISEAKNHNCKKLLLTTTNDNIYALHFFKKIGFKINKIIPNAVQESRKLKPEIPELGMDGIPIRDELELLLNLE